MMFATLQRFDMDRYTIIAGIAAMALASTARAITPHDLMTEAMAKGKASGELTGEMADQIKKATRSKAATMGKIERMAVQADKCEIYNVTVTQPDIPDMSGKIVGDYVTVTRSKFCPDKRKDQRQPELIACSVGPVSCMPGGQSSAASEIKK